VGRSDPLYDFVCTGIDYIDGGVMVVQDVDLTCWAAAGSMSNESETASPNAIFMNFPGEQTAFDI
jgi:hypothetical protein